MQRRRVPPAARATIRRTSPRSATRDPHLMAEENVTHRPAAPAAAAPKGRTAEEIRREPFIAKAVEKVSHAIRDAKEFAGEITLIADRDEIVDVARAFR